MKLKVVDTQGNPKDEHEVAFPIIENRKGEHAVHETVAAYLANRRSGTACAKTRAEVAGGSRKPWRQKGTGRARHGSIRSPIWVGGGVVFGPRPRDYSKKITKKTKKLALRKALSERLKEGDVIVVEKIEIPEPKTRLFVDFLDNLQLEGTVLLVQEGSDKNLLLAARNVPGVDVAVAESLNAYDALRYDKLVFTREAFQKIEQRLCQS
ncbi:MAG: 50S ribosomal protein L4 [Verrucomicrobia bacterium]|nr:50S ribosomal protein L4 [Verrucomicrobiota bacterium]